MKKYTQTRAKLPKDEKIIGGDVSKKMLNDRRKKFKEIFKNVKK